MTVSRNKQHYVIMTVIYGLLDDVVYGKEDETRNPEAMMMDLLEVSSPSEIPSFVKDNVYLAMQNYGEIVKAVSPYLHKWKWERLPLLTQAIILKSYAHFYYVEKVNKSIVINIAIELAKEYIDDKQAKFINALLDEVLHA